MMIEGIGWVGAVMLATCSFPLVVRAWRTPHPDQMSRPFLWWWFAGEALTLAYVIAKAPRPPAHRQLRGELLRNPSDFRYPL